MGAPASAASITAAGLDATPADGITRPTTVMSGVAFASLGEFADSRLTEQQDMLLQLVSFTGSGNCFVCW
jgi:hypothetical protein